MLSKRTVQRLRSVVARIPAEQFDMYTWVGHHSTFALASDAEELKCGTAGCLYGWACFFYPPRGEDTAVNEAGNKIFALSEDLGLLLCAFSRWPKRFQDRYKAVTRPATRLRVLRDRVEHFIATEGRDA